MEYTPIDWEERQLAVRSMATNMSMTTIRATWDLAVTEAIELGIEQEIAPAYAPVAAYIVDPDQFQEDEATLLSEAIYDLAVEVQAMKNLLRLE